MLLIEVRSTIPEISQNYNVELLDVELMNLCDAFGGYKSLK